MKHIFLFLLSLVVFQATAQTIVDPSEFPTLSSPTMNNWAIYTREDKVNRKVLPAAIRALMLPVVRQPADITYTPAATGNANDKGSFVKTPTGRVYFIDGLGNSIQSNFPYAAATIADNDVHAGVMCVPVGGWYRLSNSNTLGLPPGTLRQRVFGTLTPCTNAANPISPGQTAVVGGSGILKVNGDPDTNPYVKAQGQHYESSIAYDTLHKKVYTYDFAGSVGNRWNVFEGVTVDTRVDTAYIQNDTLKMIVLNVGEDTIQKTIEVALVFPTVTETGLISPLPSVGRPGSVVIKTIDLNNNVALYFSNGASWLGPYEIPGLKNVDSTMLGPKQVYGVHLAQGGATTGQVYKWNGTTWAPANETSVLVVQEEGADLTLRQKLNFVGSAATASDDSGNGRTNVTFDSDVNGLASNSNSGIIVRTSAGNFTGRTLSGSEGITLTNANGVSGDPTISPANDLLALEMLNNPGVPYRTGSDTWSITPANFSGATSGQVLKWDGTAWVPGTVSGGGGSQNLQQTLVIGNNTRRNIVFDSITPHPTYPTGYEKNYITINPLDTLNSGNANGASPWLLGISTNGGEIHSNQVMYMGWNMTPGGGAAIANRPGIGEGWEQWWRPGNGNTASKTEKHEVWIRRDGFPVRIASYECDNTTTSGNAALYHTVASFSLRKGIQSNPDYFKVMGDALGSGTQTTWSGLGGNLTMDYSPISTNAVFNITNSKTTGSPQLNLAGFKEISMSSGIAGTLVSWGSPQFIFSDGSFMQFTNSIHRWVTNNNQPIILRPGGFQAFQAWTDATNFGVEIGIHGIGQNSRLSVFGKSATSSDFCARFQTSTPGTDILSIRNDGRVGINNSTPARALSITGEVRVTDLTTDAPTRFVGADADGDLNEITLGTGFTLSAGVITYAPPSGTGGIYSGSGSVPSGGSTVTATDANPLILSSAATTGNPYRFNIAQGGGIQFNNTSGTEIMRWVHTGSSSTFASATRQITLQALTSANLQATNGVKSALFFVHEDGYVSLPSNSTFPTVTGEDKVIWNSTDDRIQYAVSGAARNVAEVEKDFAGTAFTIRTADFTLGTTNVLSEIVDANSGAVVVTLGADLREGFDYVVKCRRNGTNTVTFSAGGSHVFEIDGLSAIAPTSLIVGAGGSGMQANYKVYHLRRSGLNIFID